MKRLMDIMVSITGLVLFAPFSLFIMMAIYIESPGSPLFLQKRVGRHGKIFTIIKFRTMMKDTISVPTHEMNRSQVLKVGRILRKTKIDEIPQLLNVLAGQMSLVGPRPCLPSQKELIKARQGYGVLNVRPGITGLAQVQKIDMSDPERLALEDARYLKMESLSEDIKIIIRTVLPGV